MTTITIDNQKLSEKYSQEELRVLVIDFLQSKLENESIDLFEVQVSDLDQNTQNAYNTMNTKKFIDF